MTCINSLRKYKTLVPGGGGSLVLDSVGGIRYEKKIFMPAVQRRTQIHEKNVKKYGNQGAFCSCTHKN